MGTHLITYGQAQELYEKGVSPVWYPNPVQWEAMKRTEYEILFGGSRGAGKSDVGRYWLTTGNLDVPYEERTPTDWTYLNNPNYRALVIRVNLIDMEDWISKAIPLYDNFGGKFTDRPPQFVFPNPENPKLPGATLALGHLDSQDAYTKYVGQEFSRMLIEEATLIPTEEQYVLLLGSLRSPFKELRKQAFLTANPLFVGHAWVRNRFVKAMNRDGSFFPFKTTITYDPRTGDLVRPGATRVYIPALPTDNLVMMEKDPLYVEKLVSNLGITPARRKAWVEGDWDAVMGGAFEEFRPNGPLPGEPDNARHVIEPTDLRSWWFRWAACDWGYKHDSAMLVGCNHPNGQIHVYKELVANHMTPTEWGASCARALLPELDMAPDSTITLWLSHDAFQQRTDERTLADQMAKGIEFVLGPDSVFVPDLEAQGSPYAQKNLAEHARLVIRRASRHRASGWQYLHQLMRWEPPITSAAKFDPEYALSLVGTDGSMDAYHRYVRMFEKQESLVLPKLQIWNTCPRLIDALPKLMCNPPDKGGDPEDVSKDWFPGQDVADGLRYLVMAHQEYTQATQPFEEFFDERMRQIAPQGGNATVWAARRAEAEWARNQTSAVLNPVRASSRRRFQKGVH